MSAATSPGTSSAAALCAALLAVALPAQTPWTPLWIATLPVGTASGNGIQATVVDAAGVTYVTGITGSSGNTDIVTAAYSASGALLWSRVFNGAANWHDQARGIALGPGGSLWVTGNTPDPGLRSMVLLLEYDTANGALRNTVTYSSGPLTAEIGAAVATDQAGNVYVAGDTIGDGPDAALLKYDAAGTLLWRRTWDGPAAGPFSQDHALDVLVDAAGDPIVLLHGVMANNQPDYVVAKYAAATGAPRWVANWGLGGGDYPHEMALDASGDVFVSGIALDQIDKFGTIRLRGTDGALLWQAYDVIGFHPGHRALAIDGTGHVYVTGSIDPDGNQSNNDDDFYTLKYDAVTGARLWTHSYGAGCNGCLDLPTDVIVDAGGNLFLTGTTNSPPYTYMMITFQLDPTSGTEIGRSTVGFGTTRIGGAAFLALDGGQSLHGIGQARDFNTNATDIVVLKYPTRAGTRSIGTGCTGSGALPFTASAIGRPSIPSPSYAIALTDGPPAVLQGIAFGFALSPTPIPFGAPGCSLQLDLASIVGTVVVTGGTMPFPIPASTGLRGLRIQLQGVAIDANTTLAVTSNALTVLLGV